MHCVHTHSSKVSVLVQVLFQLQVIHLSLYCSPVSGSWNCLAIPHWYLVISYCYNNNYITLITLN